MKLHFFARALLATSVLVLLQACDGSSDSSSIDLPKIPDSIDIPDIPDSINIPDIPDSIDIPDIPDSIDIPDIPDSINIPDIPDSISLPSLPSLPEVPDSLNFFSGSDETDPNAVGIGADGDHTVCSYDNNIDDDGYASARVSYPCDLSGSLPATTLTGGFTNKKEQMFWLADHLTTHGYIVITMTPTSRISTPGTWKKAHLAGLKKLETENDRSASPIFNNVDLDKRNIMGYSMGGGGVLLASEETDDFASAIALAPWVGPSKYTLDYDKMTKPTFIIGGDSDNISFPSSVKGYYEDFPKDITRGLAMLKDLNHLDWWLYNDVILRTRLKVLITAILNVHLKSDFSSEDYLDGSKHDEHVNEEWYDVYEYHR